MAIEVILFDLGNVILKFNERSGENCIMDRFSGLSGLPNTEVRRIIGFNNGPHGRFGKGQIDSREFYEELCKKLRIKISFEEFRQVWCNIFLPNAPVIDLSSRLHERGYKIGLISNLDVLHRDWVKRYFGSCLTSFDFFLLSFRLGTLKPEREYSKRVRDYLWKKYECNPFHVVTIDDTLANINEFRDFGFFGIHYTGDDEKLLNDLLVLGVQGVQV